MPRIKTSLSFLLLIALQLQSISQVSSILPRSTPEAEGVSSAAIIRFLDSAAVSSHELHSIMILRHGKVITEGWWKPYRADLRHTLYSVSKSFTSTAIGFAVSENKLTVNDKVVSFFPDQLPDSVSPHLAALRVRDLLSMSVGHEQDATGPVVSQQRNWVKAFLALPIKYEPGSKFVYNSLATYMLSAIVQKLTGENLVAYLKPRLFDPLGITGMDWEEDPMGVSTGGWGLRVRTEDMAKLGQLYLQKGKWNGKQLLPAAWVEEATSMKIDQDPSASKSRKDSSDWLQGYCYQFWRSRNHSYRGDGAFGQFILVFPDQDAVIVLTAETTDMQAELNLVWKYLFPAFQAKKLAANKASTAALKKRLAKLALPVPVATKKGSAMLNSKVYLMEPNPKKVESVQFNITNDICSVLLKAGSVTDTLYFGEGKWKLGKTSRKGPSLVMQALGHFEGFPPSDVAGAYRWSSDNQLELTLRYIDSPHWEVFTVNFEGNTLTMRTRSIFETDAGDKAIILKGKSE